MDALLMCGGRGTRLDAPVEKPLFEVGGRPMVDRVADALADSRIETTHAAVSPYAPETRDHVRTHLDLPAIETPGDGYVADLDAALDRIGGEGAAGRVVLTVAADLPLLAGEVVDAVLDAHAGVTGGPESGASLAVCVPAALKRQLGVGVDESWTEGDRELSPTGLNVVAPGPDHLHVSYDARLAVNVNRTGDAEVAEVLV